MFWMIQHYTVMNIRTTNLETRLMKGTKYINKHAITQQLCRAKRSSI
jgi:hypothetical protein